MKIKMMYTFLLIFVSCLGQKKIDLNIFEKYKEELKNAEDNTLLIVNESKPKFISYFYKNYQNGYNLDEYDDEKFDDSTKNKIRETIQKYDNSFDIIEKVDNYFDLYESYYKNGNLKSTVISSWLGFAKGKSYKYYENGAVADIKDWDEGYKFTSDNIFDFIEQNEIKICKLCMTRIYKITNNDKKTWVIEFQNQKIRKTVTYLLDAENGTILNKIVDNLPVKICKEPTN